MSERSDYKTYRERQQQFADRLLKLAKEQGIEVEERKIPFPNDDVPNFLRMYNKLR